MEPDEIVYAKFEDVPEEVQAISPHVSLIQASMIAEWAAGVAESAQCTDRQAFEAAINQFYKSFEVRDGGWRERETEPVATATARAEVSIGEMAVAKITAAALNKVSGRELNSINRRLHQLWGANFAGNDKPKAGGLVREDLVNAYLVVRDEMKKRGFEVDDETELAKAAKEIGEAEPADDVVVIPNFVSIVGSKARGEEDEGSDTDVLVRADRIDGQGGPGFFIRAEDVELPLRKRIDPGKTGGMELHWSANPQGPHDDYVPQADLVLRWRAQPERQAVETGRRVQAAKAKEHRDIINDLKDAIRRLEKHQRWIEYMDGDTVTAPNIYGEPVTGEAAGGDQSATLRFVGTGAMNTEGRRGAALLVEAAGKQVQIDGEKPGDIQKGLDALLVTDPEAWNAEAAVEAGGRVEAFEADGLSITPHKVHHTAHDVHGYLIEAGDKRAAYIPEIWDWPAWAKDLGLAIVDGSAWGRDIRFAGETGGHRALQALARAAKEHGIGRVIATHIGNPTVRALKDGEKIEGVKIAEDGQSVELEEALEEAVAPGRRYRVMKPSMAGVTEYFDTTELWNDWASKKVDGGHKLLGSPKIDGFRAVISWDGSKVATWFEDSKETKTPPGTSGLSGPSFVAEGEFTARRNGKWVSRTELAGIAAGKTKAEPHFWLYDLLYWDGEDISGEPFSERLGRLKQLRLPTKNFSVLEQRPVRSKNSLSRVGKWAAARPLSEGLFLRQADAGYSFGSTDTAAKVKTVAELKVEVIEALRKSNGITYHVGLRDPGGFANTAGEGEGRLLDLGNTFVGPDQHVAKGDTLNVACEELVVGRKDGKPILFWGKPTVRGPDKSRPAYTAEQAIDLARRGHILKRETEAAEAFKAEEDTRAGRAEAGWAKNWQNLVAKGEGKFVLHGHFPSLTEEEAEEDLPKLLAANKQYHTDLRLEAPKPHGAWGFTCFEGQSDKVGEAGTRLKGMPAGKPMRGTFKLENPREWLTYAVGGPKTTEHVGRVGKERAKFFALDNGTYKLTYAREHAFEIILNGRKGVTGRYQIAYVPVEGGRVWMISRPADQDTTFPQEHKLDTVMKEMRGKGQKWLFWRDTPDAPLKRYDITRGGETQEENDMAIDLYSDLTDTEMQLIGEAVQLSAALRRAVNRLGSAIRRKSASEAKAEANKLKDALEGAEDKGGYAYGYPEPKEADSAFLEATSAKDLLKLANLVVAAVSQDEPRWDAAEKALASLKKKLGISGNPGPGGEEEDEEKKKGSASETEAGGEGEPAEGESEEVELCESIAGAVTLEEAEAAAGDPLTMRVQLIQPGWGNKKDNHFYPPEMLRRDARVFVGAKMFETDHRPSETNNRTWVSTVTDITGFTEDGAPIGEVVVHSPDFAQRVRNLAAAELLEKLECSIRATGRTKPHQEGDRKGYAVEAITSAKSVDWVTKAGAGGKAINIMEGEAEQEQEAEPKPEPTYLAKETVAELLEASKLPKPAQDRLAGANYLDEEAVKEAVKQERGYLQEITGAGRPVGVGRTEPPKVDLEEIEKHKDAVTRKYIG